MFFFLFCPYIEPTFSLFTLLIKTLWAGNEGEEGKQCCVSPRGSLALGLFWVDGNGGLKGWQGLPCLPGGSRKVVEVWDYLTLCPSVCVGKRNFSITVSPRSPIAWSGRKYIHACQRQVQEYLKKAWQIRRCCELGRGAQEQMSALSFCQRPDGSSVASVDASGERRWQLATPRNKHTAEDASMDRWLLKTRWAPSKSRCSINLPPTPGGKGGREENPEWTKITWNWILSSSAIKWNGGLKLGKIQAFTFLHTWVLLSEYYDHYIVKAELRHQKRP